MTDKVKLPREVAEAIEKIREKGGRNYAIIRAAIKLSEASAEEKVISDWVIKNFQDNLDALIIALVNGYEIEKSPEDKVREYYEGLIETKTDSLNDPYTRELAAYEASAVVKTLNLLDIKIPGVNADV
jgi:predicted mannosyl-3-phosphoglycerate phosphatase (HAD superfamily)